MFSEGLTGTGSECVEGCVGVEVWAEGSGDELDDDFSGGFSFFHLEVCLGNLCEGESVADV